MRRRAPRKFVKAARYRCRRQRMLGEPPLPTFVLRLEKLAAYMRAVAHSSTNTIETEGADRCQKR